MYIQAASSITTLNTFSAKGFWKQLLNENEAETELITPEYKEYIVPRVLRRTPKINRMTLACLEKCLEDYPVTLEAIILGTGLGCLNDTKKFLDQMTSATPGQMLSPTSFIQSGHNAIAGQVALNKGIHGYNMTHVQRGLSFEYALKDAMMWSKEEDGHLFIGAVDEKIPLMDQLAGHYKMDFGQGHLGEGGSFFIVNNQSSQVKIANVEISSADWQQDLQEMLHVHDLEIKDLNRAFVGYHMDAEQPLDLECPTSVFTTKVGRYFSSAAFGLHAAFDFLSEEDSAQHAMVINRADRDKTGLILLKRE